MSEEQQEVTCPNKCIDGNIEVRRDSGMRSSWWYFCTCCQTSFGGKYGN